MNGEQGDRAALVLQNGLVFEGRAFGERRCALGEAVFSTGMTGYIETLTDPSYYGQIITQTFPLVGNYGIIPSDYESAKIHAAAYVVRDVCDEPSNFRCKKTLDDFLKENKIPGLFGIDTRALTKVLREAGVMNALLISGTDSEAAQAFAALKDPQKKEALLKKISSYKIQNAVQSVSLDADKIQKSAQEVFEESAKYRAVPVRSDGTKVNGSEEAMKDGLGKKVVLWDFGAKANIRRELLKRGLEVETVRADASAQDILALKPDGIMLSNGPGDPAENAAIIQEVKKILDKKIPLFGICLGHQILALAKGAETSKLKYGHRGANQPVKNLETGRVYISSQNHGYAVVSKSLPPCARETFVNANDQTNEGLAYSDTPAFSVQFHPEASGGPLDTSFLFDEFVALINKNKSAS